MENITIQDILEATDGTLLCGDPSMKIDHLSTCLLYTSDAADEL